VEKGTKFGFDTQIDEVDKSALFGKERPTAEDYHSAFVAPVRYGMEQGVTVQHNKRVADTLTHWCMYRDTASSQGRAGTGIPIISRGLMRTAREVYALLSPSSPDAEMTRVQRLFLKRYFVSEAYARAMGLAIISEPVRVFFVPSTSTTEAEYGFVFVGRGKVDGVEDTYVFTASPTPNFFLWDDLSMCDGAVVPYDATEGDASLEKQWRMFIGEGEGAENENV